MIYPKVFGLTPPGLVEGLERIARELNINVQVILGMSIVRV